MQILHHFTPGTWVSADFSILRESQNQSPMNFKIWVYSENPCAPTQLKQWILSIHLKSSVSPLPLTKLCGVLRIEPRPLTHVKPPLYHYGIPHPRFIFTMRQDLSSLSRLAICDSLLWALVGEITNVCHGPDLHLFLY